MRKVNVQTQHRRWLAGPVIVATCLGCTPAGQGMNISEPTTDSGVALEVVAQGLRNPVYVTAPANDARLFIVEQPGRIRVVEGNALRSEPFLDIENRVRDGGEQGLLGLAFHPDYASNGYFYVNYTIQDGSTRIERYQVSADPNRADVNSDKVIIQIPQPYGNHNGGMVLFGPDGMLYIGMGDGGSANDPQDNGQNAATLLGSLLRIDVDGGDPYAIPNDNPFVGNPQARDEIWAIGLRNPWRFSFDSQDGLLYIGDVGQNAWEEVHVAPLDVGGLNYGWNEMEGRHCFGMGGCDQTGLTLPPVEYGHDNGCSVIGGIVYRGTALADVAGHYFYSDWCGGWLRSFRYVNGAATAHSEWAVGDIGNVLTFGEDAARNVYIGSQNGRVYRLIPDGG
ncbi:MAG: PQQ-dependent sugar dehydrogenase [Gemmatimonadota bacterium]|nr:PQQ-dependent sugar dehydrogenase [Gemmatimonadota bacterium]